MFTINLIILGIACVIVSFTHIPTLSIDQISNYISVDWDSTSPASRSTTALPRPAGPAPATLNRFGQRLDKTYTCLILWSVFV